jgi:hypothetical protein
MLRVMPPNDGMILSGAEPFEPARGPTEYIEGGDTGGRISDPGGKSHPSVQPPAETERCS